jgi:lysophospholipase L1-like esterase
MKRKPVFFLLLFFIIPYSYSQIMPEKSFTYLALGDSYTIGESVPGEENFPSQTVAILKKNGIEMAAPTIIAKTGWTTDELAGAIKKSGVKGTFSFVSLLIGVNNQYRGRTAEEYAGEFEELLKQALAFAGNEPSKIAVLSIPDWGVTPFAEGRNAGKIATEIDAFNAINRKIAEQYKVHYIDITAGTREAKNDLSLLAEDKLHPSAKEYRRWAEKLAACMQKQLQ